MIRWGVWNLQQCHKYILLIYILLCDMETEEKGR